MDRREEMYRLAYRFRKLKMWEKLIEEEMFAVQLSDGEIGYCVVTGSIGEHFSLILFPGEKGFKTWIEISDGYFEDTDEIEMNFLASTQYNLQCSFENKDLLRPEDLAEARKYAAKYGIQPRGKNAFPLFLKYQPGRFPWMFDSELDEQRMCEALEAAIGLDEMMDHVPADLIGLHPLSDSLWAVPMLRKEGDKWNVQMISLPDPDIAYEAPEYENEVKAARIRKLKKKGIWESGLLRLGDPVQNPGCEDKAPFFPLVLVTLNKATGMVLMPAMSVDSELNLILEDLVEGMIKIGEGPRTIKARDERTKALLQDFCSKTGINLTVGGTSEDLEEAMYTLLDHLDSGGEEEEAFEPSVELKMLIEDLMTMSDNELRRIPKDLAYMLLNLSENVVLPKDLEMRLRKFFH